MAKGSDYDLIVKSAELGRSCPEQWAAFLTAFKQYMEDVKDQVVSCPIENLPVAQGRAQAVVKLSDMLSGAITTTDKIARKNN